jgi:hypothetical protein
MGTEVTPLILLLAKEAGLFTAMGTEVTPLVLPLANFTV